MERVVIAVIGTGRIGSMHLENISTKIPDVFSLPDLLLTNLFSCLQFYIKWACDIKIESDQKMIDLTKKFGIPHTTTDYKEVLADKEVQAIIVTTTTDTHTEVDLLSLNINY
jgi:myo-inositol 2-dehydrogenase/D-chiro-inositol 1-dehydrogenase